MLRIIRVRLPTEWACHWRKLYFYLLCRVSLGLPLAQSLPLSICTAPERRYSGAGCFSKCLKGAVSAAVMHLWICISACFHVWAHTICILHGAVWYSGVDPRFFRRCACSPIEHNSARDCVCKSAALACVRIYADIKYICECISTSNGLCYMFKLLVHLRGRCLRLYTSVSEIITNSTSLHFIWGPTVP